MEQISFVNGCWARLHHPREIGRGPPGLITCLADQLFRRRLVANLLFASTLIITTERITTERITTERITTEHMTRRGYE